MNIELVTKQDFLSLKDELFNELKSLLQTTVENKRWLKSTDVKDLLQCSNGTLQNLRINGTLPFTKIGGTTYYDFKDVQNLLEKNKQNTN